MNFQDYIQDFTSVNVEQAQSLLTANEGAVRFCCKVLNKE